VLAPNALALLGLVKALAAVMHQHRVVADTRGHTATVSTENKPEALARLHYVPNCPDTG
jgi:hypothetical protein